MNQRLLVTFLVISFLLTSMVWASEGSGHSENTENKDSQKKAENKAHSKQLTLWKEITNDTQRQEAFEQAKNEGKYVLALFTGSDWCPPCMRLHDNVFSKKEFESEAPKTFILTQYDLPRGHQIPVKEMAYKQAQMSKYGLKGVPSVLIFDSQGQLVGKTGFQNMGPKEYMVHLKDLIKKHQSKNDSESDSSENPDSASG